MSPATAIVFGLIILALAWIWHRQNNRSRDHQHLIDACANVNTVIDALIQRVDALEIGDVPAKTTRRKKVRAS